ncbi:MFS transporter [Curtobacterium sp. ER1/6]|uniref:MFS transporter n=1 Tax=Curtobacterium sp. ER1/6 TaxID=1891920 RepID=UPI00086D0748|nr:MFS transporter [Curtobacterium sp. ER1/6]OEI68166.1 membrane protein [Curtobacterium sp. ER1/6]
MTTTSTRTAPTTRVWITAVFVAFTLSGLAIATWLGRIPSVRDSLGATTFEMGLLVLGMAVGSIGGLTFAGHIVSKVGARRGVQVASVCLAVGLVFAGFAVTYGWGFAAIWVGLIAFGFGNGLVDVSMNVSGAAAEKAGGRTIMPLFHAAFSVGTLAGAGLGALTEALEVPVVLHFAVLGVVVCLVMLAAASRFGDEHRYEEHESTATSPTPVQLTRWQVWAQPSTILIGVIVLGMALAEGSANDWLPLAMIDGHGLDNAAGSAVLTVFLAAMTAGRIAGSPLIDRFGRVPVLRASAIVAVVGLGMLIFVDVVPIAIVGVVLWGLGASLGFPMGMSAAADDPRSAALKVSAVATIGYVAFLAGPPLIGFLGEHIGLLGALLVVFVFIIAAGLASGAARETGAAAETLRRRRARRDGGDHGSDGDHGTDGTTDDGRASRLQAEPTDAGAHTDR